MISDRQVANNMMVRFIREYDAFRNVINAPEGIMFRVSLYLIEARDQEKNRIQWKRDNRKRSLSIVPWGWLNFALLWVAIPPVLLVELLLNRPDLIQRIAVEHLAVLHYVHYCVCVANVGKRVLVQNDQVSQLADA